MRRPSFSPLLAAWPLVLPIPAARPGMCITALPNERR